MRWQVLMAVVSVSLLVVTPISATVIDFSTDPNLATEWTRHDLIGTSGSSTTAAWNETNQCLDLHSVGIGVDAGLYKNNTTRLDSDAVTLTLSGISMNVSTDGWVSTGLVLSAGRSPTVFDNGSWYSIAIGGDNNGVSYSVTKSSSSGLTSLGTSNLGPITSSIPTSVKFDITRDGSSYVFLANGHEIARDSTYSSTSLPYYMMYWGTGGNDTLSLSADNFGSVVPEPGALAMAATALFSLLCYAWRKQR